MTQPARIVVDQGPDKGREIIVPVAGVRMGRSSKNDVVLADPSLSRFHCRIFFKPDEGLSVTDLGSVNQTLVNGKEILDSLLRTGDLVTLGDTTMRVADDGRLKILAPPAVAPAAAPAAAAADQEPAQKPAAAESPIDLGFKRAPQPIMVQGRLRLYLWALAGVLAAAAVISLVLKFSPGKEGKKDPPARTLALPPAVEMRYEKVQASPRNIFRYSLAIDRNNMMTIQVNDIENNRQVPPREKKVDAALLESLARSIEKTGFFDLADKYEGVQPDMYELTDISLTIGKKTHRSRVINRLEPDAFKASREYIEEFGINELGITALALPPGKLVELARDAMLLGRKLYDEREVKYRNLWDAIRRLKEAESYLETIEPKPDFYKEAVSLRGQCEEEVNEKFQQHWFLVERAIKLREWEEAAKHLRIVCEMVPDRSDDRNKKAELKLIDVDRHLSDKRK